MKMKTEIRAAMKDSQNVQDFCDEPLRRHDIFPGSDPGSSSHYCSVVGTTMAPTFRNVFCHEDLDQKFLNTR